MKPKPLSRSLIPFAGAPLKQPPSAIMAMLVGSRLGQCQEALAELGSAMWLFKKGSRAPLRALKLI